MPVVVCREDVEQAKFALEMGLAWIAEAKDRGVDLRDQQTSAAMKRAKESLERVVLNNYGEWPPSPRRIDELATRR